MELSRFTVFWVLAVLQVCTTIEGGTKTCPTECVCHEVDTATTGLVLTEDGSKKVVSGTCVVGDDTNFTSVFAAVAESRVQVLSVMHTGNGKANASVKLGPEEFSHLKSVRSLKITAAHRHEDDRLEIDFNALSPLQRVEKIFFKGVRLIPNPSLIAWNEDQEGQEDHHDKESKKKHVHLREEAGETNNTDITLNSLKSKLQFQEKLPPVLPYDEYKRFLETHAKFSTFGNLTNLKSLKLIDVMISHPNWEMLQGLPNLIELSMEKCGVKFLGPKFFSGTPKLEKLSLAENEILGLDFQMFLGLGHLKTLDLSHNKVDHISLLSFPYLPSLEELKITHNPIVQVFPSSFRSVEHVKTVQIGHHEAMVDFKTRAFRGLEHLETLHIKNMAAESIEVGTFETCKSLKEVKISGKIKFLDYDSFVASARSLQSLTLRNAGIQNISMDAFYGLDRLKKLDLSWNELDFLPHGVFDHLVNLRELDLRGNHLSLMPENAFESLLRIESIRMSENPWQCGCYMSTWRRRVVTIKGDTPVCHSPEKAKGMPVFKALKHVDLNCTETKAAALARAKQKLTALPRYGKA